MLSIASVKVAKPVILDILNKTVKLKHESKKKKKELLEKVTALERSCENYKDQAGQNHSVVESLQKQFAEWKEKEQTRGAIEAQKQKNEARYNHTVRFNCQCLAFFHDCFNCQCLALFHECLPCC